VPSKSYTNPASCCACSLFVPEKCNLKGTQFLMAKCQMATIFHQSRVHYCPTIKIGGHSGHRTFFLLFNSCLTADCESAVHLSSANIISVRENSVIGTSLLMPRSLVAGRRYAGKRSWTWRFGESKSQK